LCWSAQKKNKGRIVGKTHCEKIQIAIRSAFCFIGLKLNKYACCVERI
jgi:hypothetical protein